VGIVSAPTVEIVAAVTPAPYNHFIACPNCRVIPARSRRAAGTGRNPSVGAGIVSAATVDMVSEAITPAPDNHYIACPHCRVTTAASGGAVGTSPNPTVH